MTGVQTCALPIPDSNLVSEQLQVEDRSSMQMGAPKCEVVSGTKVRVSWRMPDQMPKEPGVHFVLQHRSEGTFLWNEVLEQYRQPPAVVEDELKEGVPYRLRVVMKNGDGEQLSVSAESEVIKVSGFNVPILTKTLRDALVPKKEEIKLEICAVGEPAPLFVWFKDGEEIVPTPEIGRASCRERVSR